MLPKMSDDKQTISEPTVVFATSQLPDGTRKSGRLTKKHVMIAIISLLIMALAVTAVLVGIKIYTDSNVEIAKYTLLANGVSQNVSVDNNVVTYHVRKGDVEAWVVQDFDREIQVSKVLANNQVNCYVTALNRSMAPDAAAIPSTAPAVSDSAPSSSIVYKVLPQAISDISFLGKKASAMCENIPTFHAVPDCGKASDADMSGIQYSNSTAVRSKRTPAFCATCSWYSNCLCACGCCSVVCGKFASTQYITRYVNGVWYCSYYMYTGYTIGYAALPSCAFNGVVYNP